MSTLASMERFRPAPLPAQHSRLLAAAAAGAAVLLLALLWVSAGTGTTPVLLALAGLCLLPAAWQLGMRPASYSVEPGWVRVHRRWLPDSRFRMTGTVERLHDPDALRGAARPPAPRDVAGQLDLHRRAPLGRKWRVYRATTDAAAAVRVETRQGTLVVSPEDPDRFVVAAQAAAR